LGYADSLARVYMYDPTAIDPALITTSVTLAVQHGDRAMFDECKMRFEKAEVPQQRSLFLSALGNFRDPVLADEALNYSLTGPLRPNEFFYIPFSVGAFASYEDKVFEWQMKNYETITAKIPPMFASFMPYMAGGCSRERLAKAQEYFTNPARNVPGMEESLAKVTDQVNDCAGLRDREGAKVAEYLKRFVAAEE
jgi:cytosol alanyl aminopeptidase